MNAPTRKRILIETLAVVLIISSAAAYAQFSQRQTMTFQLSPSVSMTLTSVNLGTYQGGASDTTQSFSDVLTFNVDSAGTYTIGATVNINATIWHDWTMYITGIGGQACVLQGGSGISLITTCSWTITSSQTFSETVIASANDGVSISNGNMQPSFTVS